MIVFQVVLGITLYAFTSIPIARLWWCNYMARKMNTSITATKEFFNDTDRRQQIIERPTSSNSKNVLKAIFEILTEQSENGKKYNRNQWRSFAKKINFVGKRKSLASLSESHLKEILTKVYLEV